VVQGKVSCRHSPLYFIPVELDDYCLLCSLKLKYDYEVPQRLHAYKQLAANGNPETHTQFLAHQETILGLVPPKKGQSLRAFRLARARFTVAQGLYPTTSALSKAMGLQPPIVLPVVRMLQGQTEEEISRELSLREEQEISAMNVYTRVAKGLRLVTRMVRSAESRSNQTVF
jgi:hypothetical protein